MLTSSNVAETDHAEFAMGTTYSDGDTRIVATGLETLVLDVAPASDWVSGDIITGQTGGKTSVIIAKLTALTYTIRERSGAYTLGEIIGVTGVGAKLADQGAAHPTVTAATDNVHKIYESLVSANTGNYPPTDVLETVPKWLEISATNRWKAFDTSIGSQAINADTITYRITPGEIIDSIAFLNINAATVRVVQTDPIDGVIFDETITLIDDDIIDWYTYFYTGFTTVTDISIQNLLPYRNSYIDITLTYTDETVAVGAIIIGFAALIGATQYNPSVGITDYSVKTVDPFGKFTITERAFSDTMSCDVLIETGKISSIKNLLAGYRATLLVWIGSDEYSSTIIYGFYRDFSIVISYPAYAICSIDVEGMT